MRSESEDQAGFSPQPQDAVVGFELTCTELSKNCVNLSRDEAFYLSVLKTHRSLKLCRACAVSAAVGSVPMHTIFARTMYRASNRLQLSSRRALHSH